MGDRPKILVVDNDPNALAGLCELLRDAGYEVASAGTDAEATAELLSFAPDVVLKETRAPGIARVETEWTIPDGDAAPQQVLMSAGELPRGVEVPWLKKPIDLDELLALLSRLTGGGR